MKMLARPLRRHHVSLIAALCTLRLWDLPIRIAFRLIPSTPIFRTKDSVGLLCVSSFACASSEYYIEVSKGSLHPSFLSTRLPHARQRTVGLPSASDSESSQSTESCTLSSTRQVQRMAPIRE